MIAYLKFISLNLFNSELLILNVIIQNQKYMGQKYFSNN